MQKTLTLTVDEDIYNGLCQTVGRNKISHFVENLIRPHVIKSDLFEGYQAMAADTVREAEALEWAEATFGDICDEKV